MTEEIIINGVDVSGCEKQGETIAGITCGNGERIRLANEIITKHKLCKDNPNCYFKQLKRKEQECEELKEELHQNFKEKDGLHLIIDRLLEASGYDTNTASAEDFEDVYENMRYEKQQLDRYKQTFTEIKEIVEGMHDLWINKTPYTDMDNLVKHLLECELNRIRYKLDEISECEAKNE